MDIKIIPTKLKGTLSHLQSKSYAHRVMIASALAGSYDFSDIAVTSEDLKATANAIKTWSDAVPQLDCGESGTTLRMMLPITMVLKEEAVFKRSEGLAKRPVDELLQTMSNNGCSFDVNGLDICAKGKLHGGRFQIAGNISSQFISGLLYALPLAKHDSTLTVTTEIKSRPYVDMTLKTLADFGIDIEETIAGEQTVFNIKGNQIYKFPINGIKVEGDWSNAAFWLTADYLGSDIKIAGLNPNSLQGDKAITELLQRFKASKASLTIDVSQIPDLLPVLAVAASFRIKGVTTSFTNVHRLRTKESDRIKTTVSMIEALGGDISVSEETIIVTAVSDFTGGIVDSFNDHRIAMAAAAAATATSEPVIIKNAQAVNKSYPHFFEDYIKLGGNIVKL